MMAGNRAETSNTDWNWIIKFSC